MTTSSTISASSIRVAGSGELFVADAGTTMPTDITADPLTGFTGLGYTTESGIVLTNAVSKTPINSWQSQWPTRYLYTGRTKSVSATFQQSQAQIVKMWLNSGDFAEVGTSGQYRADVDMTPSEQLFALFIRWVDGSDTYAFHELKASVGATGDVALVKTAEVGWQITFDIQAPDSGTTVDSFQTTDSTFAPA